MGTSILNQTAPFLSGLDNICVKGRAEMKNLQAVNRELHQKTGE